MTARPTDRVLHDIDRALAGPRDPFPGDHLSDNETEILLSSGLPSVWPVPAEPGEMPSLAARWMDRHCRQAVIEAFVVRSGEVEGW